MTHLGDRIADLVDGQLAPEAAEEASLHLAGCASCRHEVDAARLMKRRLAGLGTPEPSGDFMTRLVALGGPEGPLTPRPAPMPQGWRPAPVAMPPRMSLVGGRRHPSGGSSVLAPAAAWRPPARGLAVAMGALSLASVGMVGLAGAAGGPEPVPLPARSGPAANFVVPVGLSSPLPAPAVVDPRVGTPMPASSVRGVSTP